MVTQQRDNESADQPRKVAFKAVGVKHYPGVNALDGVDLEGYAGSVLGVCGANGAGKSTFAKLLASVEDPPASVIGSSTVGIPQDVAEVPRRGHYRSDHSTRPVRRCRGGERRWTVRRSRE